jgi:hypothetical protein
MFRSAHLHVFLRWLWICDLLFCYILISKIVSNSETYCDQRMATYCISKWIEQNYDPRGIFTTGILRTGKRDVKYSYKLNLLLTRNLQLLHWRVVFENFSAIIWLFIHLAVTLFKKWHQRKSHQSAFH